MQIMNLPIRFKASLIFFIYKILSSTWRIKFEEDPSFRTMLENKNPTILAHWHGQDLALLHAACRYRLATLASPSKDGELMNTILKNLGVVTARGSSSRGGASGLRQLIRICRTGRRNISFAVDGPRGPIYEVKSGIFECSRLLSVPIYIATTKCEKKWVISKTWNQAILPKPFSRVTVYIKEGLPPISKSVDPRDPAIADKLKQLLLQ